MKEKQMVELLDSNIDIYLNSIAVELEKTHDQWFDNFGFPLFGQTSKEYHEQVYFQSYLESYTRQLINGILKEMTDEDSADEIAWPELSFFGIYRGYTNAESEDKFGFEFINRDTRIGYRYSYFREDEIDGLLSSGNVDGITLVLWEDKDAIIGSQYGDERVKTILIWDLFQELFYDLDEEEIQTMYDLFTDRITKAVEQANSMISLTTLPGFTSSYLFKTREATMHALQKEADGLSCFYVRNVSYQSTMENSKQLIERYKLHQYFLRSKMEQAFVGFTTYAKSFLTSEYLYHYFEKNPMFDYTPIVSGYIKSIEQLLDTICTSYRNTTGIRINMGSYTLGEYTRYLSDNDRILRAELQPAKDIIVACLDSYRVESRNNLFHKHYLDNWKRVEQIRKNTIFLYVALLGAVDTSLVFNNPRSLGILNLEYDTLFSVLDDQDARYFSFVLQGKLYSDMEKEPRRKGLVFDKNGLITNTISFKRLIYDQYETVELSRFKMPSEVWTTDSAGNKKEKIWPVA